MFAVRIEHKFIDGVETKICSKCERWLELKLFNKTKCNWDGLQKWCKECSGKYNAANMKVIIAKNKKWRLANPERYKKTHADYYQAHKQEYYESSKARQLAHPEKRREYYLRYKAKNIEKYRKIQAAANKKQRSTVKGRLCGNISYGLWRSLKNGKEGNRTFEILDYTYKQLKRHLTKTMPIGYSWDDYMAGQLHLDHKTPISVFHFDKTSDDDFQRCWELKNLQLLPASDNLKKSNKLTKHFQPSLIFG